MSNEPDDVPEKMVLLNAFFAAKASMVEEVRRAIEEVLPVLWSGAVYTAEMLCGPNLWDERYPHRHKELGMIVSYCVRYELPSLECCVCKHQYPRLYRLK